jgi:Ca2+-binding RTX toxin-like protein
MTTNKIDTTATFFIGTNLSIDSVDLRFKQELQTNAPNVVFKTVDYDGNLTIYYGVVVNNVSYINAFDGLSNTNQKLFNFSTAKNYDFTSLKNAIEQNNKNAFFNITLGGNDVINGSNQDDVLSGYLGNDTIDGGNGNDNVFFDGNFSDFSLIKNSILTVTNKKTNEIDTLKNVEVLTFDDKTITVSDIPTYELPEEIINDNSTINTVLLTASNSVLNDKTKTNASNTLSLTKTNLILTTVENAANTKIILNKNKNDDSLNLLNDGKLTFSKDTIIKNVKLLNLSNNGNFVDLSLLKTNPFRDIYDGDGNDTIIGSAGADVIHLKNGNNQVKSGNGNDKIYAIFNGNNKLKNDINAGNGNDSIFINAPDSETTITGGQGLDTFQIDTKWRGDLTITDFTSGKDKFNFNDSNIVFYGNHQNLDQAQNTLTSNSNKVQIVYQQDEHFLWVDFNDDSVLDKNDLKINLLNNPKKLTAKDIGVNKITEKKENITPVSDTTKPSILSASVSDKTLQITYSESITFGASLKDNFTVIIDGIVNQVLSISADLKNQDSLKLTLKNSIQSGQNIILIYITQNDTTAIKDSLGNYADSFANVPVKNETPVLSFTLKTVELTESNMEKFAVNDNVIISDTSKNIFNGIDNVIKNIKKIDLVKQQDTDLVILNPSQINAITPLLSSMSIDLSVLTPVEFLTISPNVFSLLTPSSIASLNIENAAVLTEEQISTFSNSQLKMLSPVQVSSLSENVLNSIHKKWVTISNAVDTVFGGIETSDVVRGTIHDDYIYTNSETSYTISGGLGDDYLKSGSGNDFLQGDKGDDYLTSNLGNDTLDGEDGNDFLDGGEGNDSLIGGNGNDFLVTEFGKDYLTGGEGNDTFSIVHHLFNSENIPSITDFKTGFDKIEIKISHSGDDGYTNYLNSSENYFESTKKINELSNLSFSSKGIIAIQNTTGVDIYYVGDMSNITIENSELVCHLEKLALNGVAFIDFTNLWI